MMPSALCSPSISAPAPTVGQEAVCREWLLHVGYFSPFLLMQMQSPTMLLDNEPVSLTLKAMRAVLGNSRGGGGRDEGWEDPRLDASGVTSLTLSALKNIFL